jgi:hypothetical protein
MIASRTYDDTMIEVGYKEIQVRQKREQAP